MKTSNDKQKSAINYYDQFSKVYDLISSKRYYQKPREFAIKEMQLNQNQTILNVPCGTGQNFEYFQEYMINKGRIIAIDLSEGMLSKAKKKLKKNKWENIEIVKGDATQINTNWLKNNIENDIKFDSILCDLGLSGFPNWQSVIDNLFSLLKPNGILVIMDWYIEGRSIRGDFIKWIGKGEVNRPIWQYMKNEVGNFKLNNSFKGGEMFVASGIRPNISDSKKNEVIPR